MPCAFFLIKKYQKIKAVRPLPKKCSRAEQIKLAGAVRTPVNTDNQSIGIL
jgi:hypothetical protein